MDSVEQTMAHASKYLSNGRMVRVDRHWQASDAILCGDVSLGEDVSVWFGSVVRGDVASIRIGDRTNIQEHSVLHCDSGYPLEVEEDVTIGHRAVIHCVKVGRGSLIGMGAILLGGVVVGKECIIGAGAVVSPGTVIPDGQVVMGVPGKVIRPVRAPELEHMRWNSAHYVELARRHVEQAAGIYRG